MTVSLRTLYAHKGALLWAVAVLQTPTWLKRPAFRSGLPQLPQLRWCYCLCRSCRCTQQSASGHTDTSLVSQLGGFLRSWRAFGQPRPSQPLPHNLPSPLPTLEKPGELEKNKTVVYTLLRDQGHSGFLGGCTCPLLCPNHKLFSSLAPSAQLQP